MKQSTNDNLPPSHAFTIWAPTVSDNVFVDHKTYIGLYPTDAERRMTVYATNPAFAYQAADGHVAVVTVLQDAEARRRHEVFVMIGRHLIRRSHADVTQ